MLALAALPLFAFVGAAIDFSRASAAKVSMQGALDAAAVAMAKGASNADQALLNAKLSAYFDANFQNADVGNVQTSMTTSSTSAGYGVNLVGTGAIKTKFAGALGLSSLNVTVRSSAVLTSDGLGCVLSLNPHASETTTGQGSTSVVLNGCSLYDNSDSQTALAVGGSAAITALSVGVVGNLTGAANITTTQGIRTGIGVVSDPYASSFFPGFSGCTVMNFNGKDTITIDPGVYCGGMSINAGAKVTLNPGLYYLDGGNLMVNGGGTLTGNNVTLIFTSQNKNGFATATINGNANISLTPPKTGPTAGIVIFGDRRIPAGTTFKFNGGSTQYLGGAVYVPTGTINFSGGAANGSSCTQIIGDVVNFTGNSSLALNCSQYGTKPFSAAVVKITS